MVTFVGTQDKLADALKGLIQLDHAAMEAYDAAIQRLKSQEFRDRLTEFKGDHERHIREFSELLTGRNEEVSQEPDRIKEMLTQGKVVLANLAGDDYTILKAMKSNELDTNAAYERLNDREDLWPEAKPLVQRGLQDEKKHKDWLDKTVSEKTGS